MEIAIEANFNFTQDMPIYLNPSFLEAFGSGGNIFSCNLSSGVKAYVGGWIHKKTIFKTLRLSGEPWFNGKASESDERIFLESLISYGKNLKIDFIAQPPTNTVFRVVPSGAIAAPFGSYEIELSQTEEDLWKKMHQKHRNVIRNAENKQISIVRSKSFVDEAYFLAKQTMARSALPFVDKNCFNTLVNSRNTELFCCFNGAVLEGIGVFPFSNYSAYYFWGGSISKPVLGGMNLLHWEAIKHFKRVGIKKYDFVGARIKPLQGSKLEGIQRFKERFGATMKKGYLWKYTYAHPKAQLFHLLKRITTNQDIIDQERTPK